MNWARHYHLPKIIPIVIFTIFGLLLISAFLHSGSGSVSGKRVMAKNDATQLATAMVAFEAEYGYLPGTGRQAVGGELLTALTGSNTRINPRNIMFIELEPVRKNRGGVTNGTFIDPWGNPYQIAFADGTNPVIAGTNSVKVQRKVAVWSEPNLSTNFPWWNREKELTRRYLTSWD